MGIETVTPEAIARAAKALAAGQLVAFPTETVYGLGADATNADAVARIYEVKGRPRFNPLIAHVSDREMADIHAELNDDARKLADAFWPGPLTLVSPKRSISQICDLVSAGLETIAIRIPSGDVAQDLLRAARCPVAAPSANRAGHVSPTEAKHVADDLGASVETILDGGATTHGLESTVIDCSGLQPLLLRPGVISRADIEAVLGMKLGRPVQNNQPVSPGQLASHYAPNSNLRLNADDIRPGEVLLAFGEDAPLTDGPCINLSASGDLREAAIRFFSALRELDATGCETIAVMPIPCEGLGEAMNDRLLRAAAPR
ncbi:MAG: threonylcarbamoyl-AMP synthase [Hyphomicrobiaceae bacterium]|nr:threonylcarbamoyl-AMP synthase [Hyphomicrobiaceae bacterium]